MIQLAATIKVAAGSMAHIFLVLVAARVGVRLEDLRFEDSHTGRATGEGWRRGRRDGMRKAIAFVM